jgi:N utilization substance protein B
MNKSRAFTTLRRRARQAALQALFEIDVAARETEAVLERTGQSVGLTGAAREFFAALVRGTLQRLSEIDILIQEAAPAWPLAQMAPVDKAIMRLAVYELCYGHDAPPKVVINEAVELAKVFGSESSPRFVNGVLGTIYERVMRELTQEVGS